MLLIFLFSLSVTLTTSLAQNQRVIGGHNALSGQFPFAAAIEISTANGRYFCGGSLINSQWLVTAGQCANRATMFQIQLGSTSLTKIDSNRVTVSTSDYIIHPDYNLETLDNDIALIRLRMPVQFTNYIQPINLPDKDLEDSIRVAVVGWGQTSDEDPNLSENLQFVAVSTLTNFECQLTYGNQILDSMVCVEGNYNEGFCTGDTGSPLIQVPLPGNSRFVGIASFMSFNGCESTDPSGYTRVFPYVDWINATINNSFI